MRHILELKSARPKIEEKNEVDEETLLFIVQKIMEHVFLKEII